MKLLSIAAAAAVTLASFAAIPAEAQMASTQTERTVTRTTVKTQVQGHRGWRTKRICTVRWTHHRKVRTCRVIRVRRY